ncbi:hypothetical protein [Bradyrhizobium retamae]|uniref:Uncharacterized protein n=1 Tax=Bradyrhizobium retamae TaxID=1300035 RepID=A0A0R3NHB1_9BRAD|nr:hypothetical protein [Bradyrhizobium retamae]KRR29110.1 hypothetical protein CQ13_18395 [Bradyrhizobium retamae]
MKGALFGAAISALEKDGWKVARVTGSGKSSVRRITRGKDSKVVSIRTTQDRSIAFPRIEGDKSWRTLDEVDAVVAASVDDKENPQCANIHLLPGDEMRDRFNRTYQARLKAGHTIPIGRGVWLSLYADESTNPVHHVGAGAGNKYPPFAKVPLDAAALISAESEVDEEESKADEGLTIAEAKRRLGITFGVDPSSIKIIVEG